MSMNLTYHPHSLSPTQSMCADKSGSPLLLILNIFPWSSCVNSILLLVRIFFMSSSSESSPSVGEYTWNKSKSMLKSCSLKKSFIFFFLILYYNIFSAFCKYLNRGLFFILSGFFIPYKFLWFGNFVQYEMLFVCVCIGSCFVIVFELSVCVGRLASAVLAVFYFLASKCGSARYAHL